MATMFRTRKPAAPSDDPSAWIDQAESVERRRRHLDIATKVAAFAALAMVIFMYFDRPANDAALAGNYSIADSFFAAAFAEDFTTSMLTATSTNDNNLERFVPTEGMQLPSVANTVTDPIVYQPRQTESVDGVDVYRVVVGVRIATVGASTAATPERSYFQILVSMLNRRPRIVGGLTPIEGPRKGYDLNLGYRKSVSKNSQLATAVTGFANAYLTGKNDELERYTLADAKLTSLSPAPYSTVTLATILADSNDDQPTGNRTVRVLATFIGQTATYTATQVTFPLTVTAASGRWQVSAIDTSPLLNSNGGAVATQAPSTSAKPTAPQLTPVTITPAP